MHDVTQLLRAIDGGDMQATEDLLPVVYGELRRLANAKMRHEKSNHTLTSTALVHEAYLRLVDPKSDRAGSRDDTQDGLRPSNSASAKSSAHAKTPGNATDESSASERPSVNEGASADGATQKATWANRSHFFAAAAEAMRRILIENARRKQRIKHGGQMKRHNVDDVDPSTQRSSELIALDDALEALLAENEVAGNLIKLRFFAGLTIPQAAWSLGISESQAKRLWAYSRAWLYRQMYSD